MSHTLESQSQSSQKIALLIMGVGRSGTSDLTRVLNMLGAAVPQEVTPADCDNERGYWEPLRLVELNEDILRLNGRDQYDSRPFPVEWFDSAEAAAYVERAAALVANEYRDAPLIAIKDPRLCRLAPLYLAALNRLGYQPRVVMPIRHPSEMMESLQRRSGIESRYGERIWIRNMLEAEGWTRRYPRVWVGYNELLEDWQSLQARIAVALDLTWPNTAESVARDVEAFLDPALHRFDPISGVATEPAGPLAIRLWQILQAGPIGDETALRRDFDRIRQITNSVYLESAAAA
nr:hypothetical protein [uncultured Rhodopila sp.]